MRICFKLCVFLVVMAVSITAVCATQVSQVKTFSGTPDFPTTWSFNKINLDPSCTLNWVKVIMTLNVNGGQYVLDNDAPTAAAGSFNFGGQSVISSSTVNMLDSGFNPVVGIAAAGYSSAFSLAANVGDGSGDYSPLGPDGMVYVGGPQTSVKSGFIDSSFFSQYKGVGTYNVTVDATQWANYSGASGIEVAITPVTANGSLEIIYDYTCVPEPASILSLLGGIGMLGLFRRRRS